MPSKFPDKLSSSSQKQPAKFNLQAAFLFFNFSFYFISVLENHQYFGLAEHFYALNQFAYKHVAKYLQLELFMLNQVHYFIKLCLSFGRSFIL